MQQDNSETKSMEFLELGQNSKPNGPKKRRNSGRESGSQNTKKTYFALRDRGNCFKSSRNTHVPLAESMVAMAELLSPQVLGVNSNIEVDGANSKSDCNIDPENQADNIIATLGFQFSHCVEAIGFSGGIWLGWWDSVRLEVILWHLSTSHPVFIAFVYGSPNRQRCQLLWSELKNSIPRGQSLWISIGLLRGRRCPHFGDFITFVELHDLGFRGPPFTWHRGFLFERLDRALGNEAWLRNFPDCMVTHLPKIKSDHRPLLLVLNPSHSLPRGRPFRFLPDLFKRIANIQRERDLSSSIHLNHVDLSLRQEIEDVRHHEELLWKQKARCDWLNLGDRNTKFFHTRTLQRRKNNRITAIRNAKGNWIYDPEDIEDEANDGFPQLDPVDISFLGRLVSDTKIKEAMFDMAPLKAQGSDSFHALFF
ncbi:hypothetical protein V6Z11_A09G067300 [Gossypium hirsutum]